MNTLPMRVVTFEESRPSTPIPYDTFLRSREQNNIKLVLWLQNIHEHTIKAIGGIMNDDGNVRALI